MSAEKDGLDILRDSIEVIATDLDGRAARSSIVFRPMAWAVAASVLLIVILAGLTMFDSAGDPGVDVRLLKVRGRHVEATLVEGAVPGTIIIMPCKEPAQDHGQSAATVLLGGMR